jgi:hypothetical protein
MMTSRTSWRYKLEKTKAAKVVAVPASMQKRFGKGQMLIPRPLDVDALIRTVPRGSLVTVAEIRRRLAQDYHVDLACPLTTGIFVRIAAEAANEDIQMRRRPVTPYWRVVGEDGSLNPKFPGGVEMQSEMLSLEGHRLELARGGKKPRVVQYKEHLISLAAN